MNMTLGELISWLTKIQEICESTAATNVQAVRLKGITVSTYDYNSYIRENKRERELSVWIESYTDGPQAPTNDPTQGA